jgi:6,7-dimethyl-8-ribityllumazine synthase
MSERAGRTIEGALVVPAGARIAVVASRFNHLVVDRLVEGALDAIARHGGDMDKVTLVHVPGAWELPQALSHAAKTGQYDALVALGAVIRGATPHFDLVAGEANSGCARVAAASGLPVAFGVLTTDSIEQALERAGTKAGNKGWDAALTAIEMLNLYRALDSVGTSASNSASKNGEGPSTKKADLSRKGSA